MEDMPKYELSVDSHKQLAVAFIVGLLVGAGIIWVWTANTKEVEAPEKVDESAMTKEEMDEKEANPSFDTTMISDEKFVVQNQPAGNSVAIDSVMFPNGGGWVVIHEIIEGALANALGAQRFEEGVWSGSVTLLRNTVVGKTYAAVLYGDNGDGVFDLHKDAPLTNTSGTVIASQFIATE